MVVFLDFSYEVRKVLRGFLFLLSRFLSMRREKWCYYNYEKRNKLYQTCITQDLKQLQ